MTDNKPQDKKLLNIAENIARETGELLVRTWQSGDIEVDRREQHDVKLAADKAAEELIIQRIRANCPGDGIISEESGESDASREGIWIVDPLDGTVNFSHGHPHFCVSIARCQNGEPEVGVVYDPVRKEMFSARRGGGASCNGASIAVSCNEDLGQAMLAVGFGKFPGQGALRQMEQLAGHVQKLRISGSAALDLAYLAAGRLDGYCETKIFVWDLAAGLLIAREAGAVGFVWPEEAPWQRSCLAASPGVAEEAMKFLYLNADNASAGWVVGC